MQIKEKIERVCLGCVVGVSFNEASNVEYFFILPVASGTKIYQNDFLITTLTLATPLGRALTGKEIGETSEISITQNKTFTIAELY
jgi:transcription elongation GreA/GreB family factor